MDAAHTQPLSMGVHESQSLLWERMVGLSRPFCEYLLPLMKVRAHVCARGVCTYAHLLCARACEVGLGRGEEGVGQEGPGRGHEAQEGFWPKPPA